MAAVAEPKSGFLMQANEYLLRRRINRGKIYAKVRRGIFGPGEVAFVQPVKKLEFYLIFSVGVLDDSG